MMCYCNKINVEVDGVQLTTPACDLVDVPAADTDHTENVVAYLANSMTSKVGISDFSNYTFHSTDNTQGSCHAFKLPALLLF
jgi:hypothetical protein